MAEKAFQLAKSPLLVFVIALVFGVESLFVRSLSVLPVE